VVICLQQGTNCLDMVQLLPLHPKPPSSLVSFKSRLVLPCWNRLTQVVLENRPLSRCISSSSCSSSSSTATTTTAAIWLISLIIIHLFCALMHIPVLLSIVFLCLQDAMSNGVYHTANNGNCFEQFDEKLSHMQPVVVLQKMNLSG